ncbi:hypothetical protein B0H21DRAFT_877648 [Amylocystis lapponica]|nr:hypothetical protein B0H21DRAFT_877648 [Amylocystis lapponica]
MTDEMPSWKSYVNAASRSVKTYVSQRDLKRVFPANRALRPGEGSDPVRKQSWGQWAGQKLRRSAQTEGTNFEKLSLFPGWAARRYRRSGDGMAFDVEVFVSGFASRSSGLGFGTRSGRAFLRLAKGFAALPKLTSLPGSEEPNPDDSESPLIDLTDEPVISAQVILPPEDMKDNDMVEALESRIRDYDADAKSGLSADTESVASSYQSGSSMYSTASSASGQSNADTSPPAPSSDLQRWHANLEARLHPFWASALSTRTVRVSLFASDPSLHQSEDDASSTSSRSHEQRPLIVRNVLSASDGSFQARFRVPWEDLCQHPAALQLAFGERDNESDIFVLAELFPAPSPAPSPTYAQQQFQMNSAPRPRSPLPTVTSGISIPLTYSTIRLISDIDDTVKMACVHAGARAVFHNVFVKDLTDSVIHGMGDWYTAMWKRGVRFHYVSNGPFELLPVVNEFFQLSRLPLGSIKLRSYAGRSLFSGLLSAPAARKRAGIFEVLDSFPESQFMLVGDSGEQDLELYASIAKERPAQILAIFIRDATAPGAADGGCESKALDDPVGASILREDAAARAAPLGVVRRASTRSAPRHAPMRSISESTAGAAHVAHTPVRTLSGNEMPPHHAAADGYFAAVPPMTAPVFEEPVESASPGVATPEVRSLGYEPYARQQPVSDAERRRGELQMRVYRARLETPQHIPLRVFRNPEECVEAMALIDQVRARGPH